MNIADPLRYPKIDLTETQIAEIRKLKARMEADVCRAEYVGIAI